MTHVNARVNPQSNYGRRKTNERDPITSVWTRGFLGERVCMNFYVKARVRMLPVGITGARLRILHVSVLARVRASVRL